MTTTTDTRDQRSPVFKVHELTAVLLDPDRDRTTRLLRLQGWRGDELTAARESGLATHLGPAVCAVAALAGAITGSVPVIAVLWATALVGMVAANHPAETAYNWVARRAAGTLLPPNRAGKRLACAIGTVFLGASLIAFSLGAPTVGRIIAGVMGSVAAFVAVTGICVPSIIFTLLWGSRRAAAPSLAAARRD